MAEGKIFGGIADRYDRMNRIMSLSLDRRWRRMALGLASLPAPDKQPASPVKVLDLACGTGDFTIEILRRCPGVKVTGVDISPEMLAVARRKCNGIGGCEFMEGDAQNLEGIPSSSCSLVVCAFGFRNFLDKAKALDECRRVLKDGGELVVLELFRPTVKVAGALVGAWLALVSVLFAGRAKDEYAYLRRSIAGTVSADEFVSLAEATGFSLQGRRNLFQSATCLSFLSASRHP